VNSSRAVDIYRSLLRVYPRRFRDEYREDMALLFAEQLRDEPASRVWSRSLIDLTITIPARHLEAHMNRPPSATVPVVFAALSVTGVVAAILGGSNLAIAGFGLAVAVMAGILTVASWRTTRAVTAMRPASAHWWQILLGGVGVLATTIVALNIIGEVPEGWWVPMMLTLLAGIMTTATGLILGVAHLTTHRPHNATS
jgi:hypothetical protein